MALWVCLADPPRFSEGQRVRVNGSRPENLRGNRGTIAYVARSNPDMIFFFVNFDGGWGGRYFRDWCLDPLGGAGLRESRVWPGANPDRSDSTKRDS